MSVNNLSCINSSLSDSGIDLSSFTKEDLNSLLGSVGFSQEEKKGNLPMSLEFKKIINDISNLMEKRAQGYIFNTFGFMFRFLSQIKSGKEDDLSYLLSTLDNLEYNSISDMDIYNGGNCVDFALKMKRDIAETMGIPLKILGVFPKQNKYSDVQKLFMKFRHVSLCYNDDGYSALYEPSWRHFSPIILNHGYFSWGDNFSFKTVKVGDEFIEQEVTLLKSKSSDLRCLSLEEVTDNDCQNLTKRLTRIPRKLEIINQVIGDRMSFISFSPENKGVLKINIEGNIMNKRADQITLEENNKLSELFYYDDIKCMLEKLFQKYYSINKSFRIK